ncbi:MAG: replicative DNA helicase [Alphaproteobacteria bacterium]|nr:replicative DNA helicase [Alphaproteobacteria bacterium]MCW5739654.1 replicative DNA helicase [Alphaproteobacteria bacterium]
MSNVAWLNAAGDREAPHDFAMEQAVLGVILVDNGAMHALDFLRPDHFADPLHGMIFAACRGLVDRKVVATPNMVAGMLAEGDFKGTGITPVGYLAKLAMAAIHTLDAADYGQRLVSLHHRRQLCDIGNAIIAAAHEPGDRPARELVAEAESMLAGIDTSGHATDRVVGAQDSTEGALLAADAAMRDRDLPDRERQSRRIVTGLRELDAKLRIEPGDVVYIAGATSSGKSALADNIAEANELRGVGVGIFAMEMSSGQWATRRLARHSGISSTRIKDGDISQGEYNRIDGAARALKGRPMWLDDTPGLSVAQIRSRLRRLKRQHGIGLAIVDYLQLMQPDDGLRRAGTRAEELGQMTRALKGLAQELGIALIVLSQINRGVNVRDDKRPDLGDLRESGSIEQDANAVLFVYREEYYLARSKPAGRGGKPPTVADEMEHLSRLENARGKAEIIVAKQRDGEAPFTAHCRWDGVRTQFHDGGLM